MHASPVVALLESRLSRELSRLVERHGGTPLCVQALRERPDLRDGEAAVLLDQIAARRHDLVVFLTGRTVTMLFERAERAGRRVETAAALRRAITVCRGPKPAAALRGFGVAPTHTALGGASVAEVVDVLSGLELAGRRVLLFHYGERSATLAETLLARRADLDERWIYRWELPEDTSLLEDLVARLVGGHVDALAVTCQVQFRHLVQVADRLRLEAPLTRALNGRVVVGAVGTTCEAALRAYGVIPRVVPVNPKMGPLVVDLMRWLREHPPRPGNGSPPPVAAAN